MRWKKLTFFCGCGVVVVFVKNRPIFSGFTHTTVVFSQNDVFF